MVFDWDKINQDEIKDCIKCDKTFNMYKNVYLKIIHILWKAITNIYVADV